MVDVPGSNVGEGRLGNAKAAAAPDIAAKLRLRCDKRKPKGPGDRDGRLNVVGAVLPTTERE